MEMKFNITGERRKELVQAITAITGIESKYLYMPSCAYEIGNILVDKTGTVTVPNAEKAEIIEKQLALMGFIPESKTKPENENYELTVTVARDALADEDLEKLQALLASKGTLIKKALGIENFPIEITESQVRFPWFQDMDLNTDEVNAYSRFIAALCNMAKTQKRISAKESKTENEKYAFRCFLLRLGFIGDNYKQARKILLRNLEGSSAFKGGKQDDVSE